MALNNCTAALDKLENGIDPNSAFIEIDKSRH